MTSRPLRDNMSVLLARWGQWGRICAAIFGVAVHVLQRWVYTAWMSRVPRLDIGLVPVVQMLVMLPLIVRSVARWCERS